jgi:hypothetical protein
MGLVEFSLVMLLPYIYFWRFKKAVWYIFLSLRHVYKWAIKRLEWPQWRLEGVSLTTIARNTIWSYWKKKRWILIFGVIRKKQKKF